MKDAPTGVDGAGKGAPPAATEAGGALEIPHNPGAVEHPNESLFEPDAQETPAELAAALAPTALPGHYDELRGIGVPAAESAGGSAGASDAPLTPAWMGLSSWSRQTSRPLEALIKATCPWVEATAT